MKRPARARSGQLLPRGSATWAALALAGAASSAVAGWNPYAPGVAIEVGPQSGGIAIADFNGDGHADILADHPLSGRASLLVGDGHGEFPMASRAIITFGYNAAAITVGDVNGDGHPDLAVASREGETSRMHILLNEGGTLKESKDSQFDAGRASEHGWKPQLTLADVNGDKVLDLVSADRRQSKIDVFYGAGAGRFALGQTIKLDEGFVDYTCIVGDLNADERTDLIAAASSPDNDEPGQLVVLLGNERGEVVLAPQLSAKIPAAAQVKALADLDGDQQLDIVLTHDHFITALTANKEGKLAPSPASPFDLGYEAFGVAAVHAGFEDNDILIAATVNSLDVLFQNEGELNRACASPIPAGPGAYQVAAGDLNGDSVSDVVTNSFEGDRLTMLLSN